MAHVSNPDTDTTWQQSIKIQEEYAKRINKIEINFKKEGKKRSILTLNNRLQLLTEVWNDFKSNHLAIIRHPSVDSATPYFKNDLFDQTQEHTQDIIAEIQQAIITIQQGNAHELPPPPPLSGMNISEENLRLLLANNRTNTEVRMPHIQIPTFSGNYYSWTPFYDLFRSMVHEKATLSGVQKLHYLKSSVGGEAKSLIDHLQITDANYNIAWTALVDRYENKRLLVNAHIKNLMTQGVVKVESAAEIRKLLDKTQECLNCLMNLDIDVESWDPMINYIITQRLDSETHRLWEQSLKNPKQVPTFAEMKLFLETRFQSLEMMQQSSAHIDNKTNKRNTAFSSVHQNQNQTTSSPRCSFCNAQEHSTFKCNAFLQMSEMNRLKWAQNASKCTNCLRSGHNSYSCTSKNRCTTCKKNHHSLLHIQRTNPVTTCNISRQAYVGYNPYLYTPTPMINNGSTYTNPFSQPNYNYNSQSSNNAYPTNHPNQRTIATTPLNTAQPTSSQTIASNVPSQSTNQNIQSHYVNSHTPTTENEVILLATALVNVPDKYGCIHQLRALIDQGSEASFITESAVQKLQLPKTSTSISISGICNMKNTSTNTTTFQMNSTLNNAFSTHIRAFILPQITNVIPVQKSPVNWEHLTDLQLADPTFSQPGKIDILIGAESYGEIIMPGLRKSKHNKNTPIAQQTQLGWIITGRTNNTNENYTLQTFHTTVEENVEDLLKKFWAIEEPPPMSQYTSEEIACQSFYDNTTYRNSDGSYTVSLPFKPPTSSSSALGRSKERAIARLMSLEKTFAKNHTLKTQYVDFIREFIKLKHAHFVKPLSINDINNIDHYYMPHQAVIRESSTTTKLRVVFDASSKSSSGISLNDKLIAGPTIQRDLFSIILKWRTHKIALTSDIEKMYRQIKINSKDLNYQRILWRENPTEPIREICLNTVTYGTSSAPFLAIKTLQRLAKDDQEIYPFASQIVLSDFYVDDLMTGTDTEDEAIRLKNELCALCKRGGFNLRKWMSNSESVLQTILPEDRAIQLPLDLNPTESYKALGIHWNPTTDTFIFKLHHDEQNTKPTKRSILALAAKLFDPLGWIAPVAVMFKIIIQKLWMLGVSWDETIPDPLRKEWSDLMEELPHLNHIQIPRWITNHNKTSKVELHGFCDASNQAYAAVIYARVTDEFGKASVTLVSSKTRVSPIKTISIPRLELCGAVLLSNLVIKATEALQTVEPIISLWTDSTIVLSWIHNQPHKYKTFVGNRISEIQSNHPSRCWNYIPTHENPADCATRGVKPSELQQHCLWWTGPHWLVNEKSSWITSSPNQPSNGEEEARKICMKITTHTSIISELLTKHSSITAILRILSYIRRFIHNYKSKPSLRKSGFLKVDELADAMIAVIKDTQRIEFANEIQNLQNGNPVSNKSKLLVFNPILNKDGIICVGGRLRNANIDTHQKFPIILPSRHPLTTLIIDQTHRQTLHGGTQLVLNATRIKYWILNGRNTIRYALHKCIRCYRFRKEAYSQQMGNLPESRITLSRPFANVGVDFAGPITMRMSKGRGNKTYKGYISVFVCMSTKAIHLEAVSDLTSEAFLAALRRFFGRRGLSSNIYSDNATNFVGADRMLQSERKQFIDAFESDITVATTNEGVQWHFIPPVSPNFGGLWEAGVKSMKTHLKKVLGETTLTFEEFNTTLIQIEACLNSRPLYPLTEDPDDLEVLTPGHFLIGSSMIASPYKDVTDKTISTLKRWELTTKLYQQFWKRWHLDYLQTLQQRPKKHSTIQSNPSVNDVVIIKEDNMPPTKWNIGRITQVFPGADNITRVVSVKTEKGIYKRPCCKLIVLPISDNIH